MQYILTEKEYESLKQEIRFRGESVGKVLLMACSVAAEGIPRNEYGWKGCVWKKTTEYCDNCPVIEFCPYENKNWSK